VKNYQKMPSLKPSLYYLSKRELFIKNIFNRKINPLYLKCCTFFGTTLIDRTQTIDTGLNWNIIDKIPQEATNLSFGEICKLRAEYIVGNTEGKLKLLWSGGIDSTVALISILQRLETLDQIDRLEVLYSDESIKEFPSFYQEICNRNLKKEQISSCIFDHIYPSDNIITGENGDQLFGSDKLKVPVITKDAFKPYKEILYFLISRKLGTEKFSHQIIDYLAPQIKKSSVPIKTLYDYLWWMNFSLKWQSVSMRLIHGLERTRNDLEKNTFHFFKDALFERWSVSNHHLKIKEDWKSYKYIAKEYIFHFHKNEEYFINKEKEQSLKEVLVRNKKPFAFLYPNSIKNKINTTMYKIQDALSR
ncbi:MAG: hypothetical protein AAGI07_15485, partial [Bacteroidota bacterium]